ETPRAKDHPSRSARRVIRLVSKWTPAWLQNFVRATTDPSKVTVSRNRRWIRRVDSTLFRRKLTWTARALSKKKIAMALTLVEKIAARHADGLAPRAVMRAGDFVSIRPRHVMTHDNTGAVIPKFKQIGATAIADPSQP